MDLSELNSEEIEAAARKQGWKPEDEWQGDPPKRGFVSAEEFLKVGDESLPVVAKERDELREQLDEAMGRIDSIEQSSGRYRDFMDKALQAERRRVEEQRAHNEKLLQQLSKDKAQAISEADGDKVLEIEQQMDDIRDDLRNAPPPSDPEIDAWMEANKWYKDDKDLAAVADGVSIQLRNEQPTLQGRAHLDELSKRVKDLMPHKFENPKRKDPPPVGGARRGGTNGRTFDDLPKEAKDAYFEFKDLIERQGQEYTKKQYLENYDWDE